MEKSCRNCNKNLTIDFYYKSSNWKAYPDGHINWCKECMKKYKKEKKEVKEKPTYKVEVKEIIYDFD